MAIGGPRTADFIRLDYPLPDSAIDNSNEKNKFIWWDISCNADILYL